MARKLSPKYWHNQSNTFQHSRFGFIIRYRNCWYGFVIYWYSDTPHNIKSFTPRHVCVIKARTANAAKQRVNRSAEFRACEMYYVSNPQIILMFPTKRLFSRIKRTNQAIAPNVSGLFDHLDTMQREPTQQEIMALNYNALNTHELSLIGKE